VGGETKVAGGLKQTSFDAVSLNDPFFDSLKEQYQEFPIWFAKKALMKEPVLVVEDEINSQISGFVYLKVEDGEIDDVTPALPPARRLKVGTMKIVAHGTKVGERVIKKIFDRSLFEKVEEIYVTVFDTHQSLINLFKKYGFIERGNKNTVNGTEVVLVRSLLNITSDPVLDYPYIKASNRRFFLLAVYPGYHSNLFPDSLLRNENADIVDDISHSNTIHKVYVGGVALTRMNTGDIVIIYRTTDKQGLAKYRSVATSVCVVENSFRRSDFKGVDDFSKFAAPHSVFSDDVLRDRYSSGKRLYAAKMLYNYALPKRPIRKVLMETIGISEQPRWDLREITRSQFDQILVLGDAHEGLVVN
jgi:hypothetical protein